jgi:hypothetical protein
MSAPIDKVSVRAFLETARQHRSLLARGLGWNDGSDVLGSLVERAAGGWIPRRGVAGSIRYTVHGGTGCRLCREDETACVDGDVLPDGDFSFDIWRIKQYAESVGATPPQQDQIISECEELVRTQVLRCLRKNWYACRL